MIDICQCKSQGLGHLDVPWPVLKLDLHHPSYFGVTIKLGCLRSAHPVAFRMRKSSVVSCACRPGANRVACDALRWSSSESDRSSHQGSLQQPFAHHEIPRTSETHWASHWARISAQRHLRRTFSPFLQRMPKLQPRGSQTPRHNHMQTAEPEFE